MSWLSEGTHISKELELGFYHSPALPTLPSPSAGILFQCGVSTIIAVVPRDSD